jgi:hypothetical protein
MKVGDMVRLLQRWQQDYISGPHIGVVVDMMEDELTGFWEVKVLFPYGTQWYSDVQLEVISESR